jgi:hypothetical protein
MPSLLHEGLIALVRERPQFAAELLRDLLSVPMPAFTTARLAEATLNELVPTEYHADAVLSLPEEQRAALVWRMFCGATPIGNLPGFTTSSRSGCKFR